MKCHCCGTETKSTRYLGWRHPGQFYCSEECWVKFEVFGASLKLPTALELLARVSDGQPIRKSLF
jgi:hypothetical protein